MIMKLHKNERESAGIEYTHSSKLLVTEPWLNDGTAAEVSLLARSDRGEKSLFYQILYKESYY